jgi:PBP1b-binding outer membrane lipoprotein LpoB
MKNKKIAMSILCPALIFGGCATAPVTHVDPSGGRTLATVSGINMQDWYDASATMIDSLRDNFINAGKLQTPPGQPALLAISRIVNSTGTHIDPDMLVKKIRVDLLRVSEGKIVTSTVIGPAGAEDPIAEEERRRTRLQGIEPSRPNYTLSGKIIEQTARAGNIREASYVFQLSLTKNPEGFAVWEDERTITKQGKRSGLGF